MVFTLQHYTSKKKNTPVYFTESSFLLLSLISSSNVIFLNSAVLTLITFICYLSVFLSPASRAVGTDSRSSRSRTPTTQWSSTMATKWSLHLVQYVVSDYRRPCWLSVLPVTEPVDIIVYTLCVMRNYPQ